MSGVCTKALMIVVLSCSKDMVVLCMVVVDDLLLLVLLLISESNACRPLLNCKYIDAPSALSYPRSYHACNSSLGRVARSCMCLHMVSASAAVIAPRSVRHSGVMYRPSVDTTYR